MGVPASPDDYLGAIIRFARSGILPTVARLSIDTEDYAMAVRRCLLELGTGVDLHGQDATKAARRAVFDALRHSSVAFPRIFGYAPDQMLVDVTIAVPYPETVVRDDVLEELPYGTKSINVIEGGIEVPGAEPDRDSTIVANAAIVVSLDVPD